MALRNSIGLALWLAACAPGGDTGGTIEVTTTPDRAAADFAVVRVTGLSNDDLQLATGDPPVVAVFVAEDSVSPGTPALSGTWRMSGDTLLFTPRFAPSPGLALWVRADLARLGRNGPPTRWWRFELREAASDTSSPRLVAVHPSADSLPENLLRWYLEFSTPMRPGQVMDHVRLIDDQGNEDRTAFLDTSEELWDPDGRRLTLLFDPGRVKRGIRTNLEQGRPLQSGRTYRLRIERGWQDFAGRGLDSPAERRFVATVADHHGPDPQQWRLSLPIVGETAPLVVTFGEPLDHALAARLITVADERGTVIDGQGRVSASDREWRFTPSTPWRAGRYQLRASPELEDVAGNRPGRAFDHEAGTAAGGTSTTAPLVRWFDVKRPGSPAQ